MKTKSKNPWMKAFDAAWEKLFAELPATEQAAILSCPDGQLSGELAARAWKLVEETIEKVIAA